MQRINESLVEFVGAWNHHKVRTLNNRTPTQILLVSDMQGTNCGVDVFEDEFDIYDILNDADDLVIGENQVVCDSRYCPFNEMQLAQFESQVLRFNLQAQIDVSRYDMLFQCFVNALRVAMNLLSVV